MSTWAQRAGEVIARTYLESQQAGLSSTETAKAIDAAYPFGERANHPYKAWLDERRRFFAKHGLTTKRQKTQAQQIDDLVARMGEKRHWAAA